MKRVCFREVGILVVTLYSAVIHAEQAEITKISDYKKVQVQFGKEISLNLSQFVRDIGRRSSDNKNPSYRLLHESENLMGSEDEDIKVSCKIYQKTMLSNRTKNYSEEAPKYEKIITEKTPILLSSEQNWTITRVSPNDLGILVWLQSEKKNIQIDCEKKNSKGEEQAMRPKDVLLALSANGVKFMKDGKELKSPSTKTEENVSTDSGSASSSDQTNPTTDAP